MKKTGDAQTLWGWNSGTPEGLQLTSKTLQIRQLIEERSKYEAQMKEANEMLEKIKKEAEEAKADPVWIK